MTHGRNISQSNTTATNRGRFSYNPSAHTFATFLERLFFMIHPNEEQFQELEAFSSVFDSAVASRINYSVVDGLLTGTIVVQFEDFSSPCELSITDENGVRQSVKTTTLPSANLYFTLPSDYPQISCPSLSLECIWMSSELIDDILASVQREISQLLGMSTLFFSHQAVVDIVRGKEDELKTVNLDQAPYIREKNLSAGDVLRLIKDNQERSEEQRFDVGCYDCDICLENSSGKNSVKVTPCNHVFCRACMECYIEEKTRGSRQVRAITCPGPDCESIISQTLIRDSIGESEFERYETIVLEGALSAMDDVVICPRRSCQLSVILKEDNRCLAMCSCGYAFCVLCRKIYHGVEECSNGKLPRAPPPGADEETMEVYRYNRQELVTRWNNGTEKERIAMGKWYGGYTLLKELIETIQNEEWIESKSKLCPKCAIPIEKTEGCNKMICSKCRSKFCWLCLSLLYGDPYAHYGPGGPCENKCFAVELEEDEERVDQEEGNPVDEPEEEEQVDDLMQGLFD